MLVIAVTNGSFGIESFVTNEKALTRMLYIKTVFLSFLFFNMVNFLQIR